MNYRDTGWKGLFGTNEAPDMEENLTGAGATDSVTGRVIKFQVVKDIKGDFTLAIKSTKASGTYPTITVSMRRYYDSDLGSSDYVTIGTFNSDGLHEFNIANSINWYLCNGYQIKLAAASGTFNIDVIAKGLVR